MTNNDVPSFSILTVLVNSTFCNVANLVSDKLTGTLQQLQLFQPIRFTGLFEH